MSIIRAAVVIAVVLAATRGVGRDRLVLVGDTDVGEKVVSSGDLTIDLNGHRYSASRGITVETPKGSSSKTSLTFVDSSGQGLVGPVAQIAVDGGRFENFATIGLAPRTLGTDVKVVEGEFINEGWIETPYGHSSNVDIIQSELENSSNLTFLSSTIFNVDGSDFINNGSLTLGHTELSVRDSDFTNLASISSRLGMSFDFAGGRIMNLGTFESVAGNGKVTSGELINNGVFFSRSNLEVNDAFVSNSGQFRADSIAIDNAGNFVTSGAMRTAQVVVDSGGSLGLLTGSSTSANVKNGGTIFLGQNATPTIQGSFSQRRGGTFSVSFANRNDRRTLRIDGPALLSGRLNVSVDADFVPGDLDEYVILEAESLSGRFSEVSTEVIAGHSGFDVVYTDTSVMLRNFRRPAPERSAETGNYYEVVSFGAYEDAGWHSAEEGANARSFQGIEGHLVTITSAEEEQFLHDLNNRPPESLWMGANDIEEEGTWKWVAGPEKGSVFWEGDGRTGTGTGFSNWGNEEPNDLGGEDGGAWNWAGGVWNDFPLDRELRGYIVEYSLPSGDATGDGVVDSADFAVFRDNFGNPNADTFVEGDFDGNNAVDLNDFNILKTNFGTSAASVPEPASWAMAVIGAAVVSVSRRKRSRTTGVT